jgi:hypothetical protein
VKWRKNWQSWKEGPKNLFTPSFVSDSDFVHLFPLYHSQFNPGQRLAAQKGESDDLVGAMKAQERQNASESLSDDEED